MKPYFDEWKFQNIDEYARHDVAGFNMWGSCKEFNTAWKEEAKKNPNLDILFLQFEEMPPKISNMYGKSTKDKSCFFSTLTATFIIVDL